MPALHDLELDILGLDGVFQLRIDVLEVGGGSRDLQKGVTDIQIPPQNNYTHFMDVYQYAFIRSHKATAAHSKPHWYTTYIILPHWCEFRGFVIVAGGDNESVCVCVCVMC
jgi:hypothetical protein